MILDAIVAVAGGLVLWFALLVFVDMFFTKH